MEIGSLYEIDPASITKKKRLGQDNFHLQEVDKYRKGVTTYTASGREAIALALKSIEKYHPEIGKRCLMPAYMCDSVFFPFQRAGWELSFYHINQQMKAEQEELERLIAQVKPGVLFIHDYYGLDTWRTMHPFLQKVQEQGIFLMEDMTQAYYLTKEEFQSDFVVGSLRKWYSIPDGGFLTTNQPVCAEAISADTCFANNRLELQIQKWNYLYGNETKEENDKSKEAYLRKNRETEEWLDHFPGISGISTFARDILTKEDENECRQRRILNYRVLHQGSCGFKTIFPLWKEYEPLAAPLYFPIYTNNRSALQSRLGSRAIYAPVLWPVGNENRDFLDHTEHYIFEHLLALPLDQRYGKTEMEHILEVLQEYDEEQIEEKQVAL